MAARTLASGFMAHMTSPAREWKELTIPEDPDLAKWGPAKEWLERVRKDMSDIHRGCGVYKTFPTFYKDAGGFGTGAFMVQEDLTAGASCARTPSRRAATTSSTIPTGACAASCACSR
jgi:hypothetical protein